MKKSVAWILGASLTLNVALAALWLMPSRVSSAKTTPSGSTAPANAAAQPRALASTVATNTAAPLGNSATSSGHADLAARLKAARTDDEIRQAIAELRASGVPGNVIRALVTELVRARFAAREPTMPFWRRNSPTPDYVAATQALAAERRSLLESLLGADGSPAATLDTHQRELRYGTLSDEKLNAVMRIERDYDDLRAKAFAETGGGVARVGSTFQQQQLMDAEKLRDLAAFLTPQELEQYEMRNTLVANSVMRSVSSIDVTGDGFAVLYHLQKQLEADFPNPALAGGQMDMDAFMARQAAQLKQQTQVRALLSDERFFRYLENADPNYAAVARFAAQQPGVTSDQAFRVYQLQSELQSTLIQASKAYKETGKAAPPDIPSFEKRLTEIIGPAAAAAFKKQGNGRMFVSPPRVSSPGSG
jgi:hypothetical protein